MNINPAAILAIAIEIKGFYKNEICPWGRNAWRTPKNVYVGGYLRINWVLDAV